MRARGSVESVHRALIQETLVQGFDAGRPLGVATIAHDHFDAVLKAGHRVLREPERCTAIGVPRHKRDRVISVLQAMSFISILTGAVAPNEPTLLLQPKLLNGSRLEWRCTVSELEL